jgi:transposase
LWCSKEVTDALPTDAELLERLLLTERQRHSEELEQAALRLQARDQEIDRLSAIIRELQRHRFGRRFEQLDPDQLALALEDVEQTVSASEAAVEKSPASPDKPARRRKTNRGSLPAHLPREEVVLDLADRSCACCGGLKVCIGEDVSERLDVVPVQFKVIVTRRPKYACRACQGEVTQAPAPERLVENGVPTEATVAQVIVAKYADHLPLYRQAQIWARQGIEIDRSTMAD